MNGVEVRKRLKKYIQPLLPGFHVVGRSCAREVQVGMLVHITVGSSRWEKSWFDLGVNIDCLFSPQEFLTGSHGVFRYYGPRTLEGVLTDDDVWLPAVEKTRELALPFIHEHQTYDDFVRLVQRDEQHEDWEKGAYYEWGIEVLRKAFIGLLDRFGGFTETKEALAKDDVHRWNPHYIETLAYIAVWTGNSAEAIRQLRRATYLYETRWKHGEVPGWLFDLNERCKLILNYLENDRFDAAKEQLLEWRAYSLKHLKFEHHALPIP